MMFNGLLMCTDSDSDFKESVCRSSELESPSSSCASARAQYYHNKLLATIQILQNKEETVRVQTESLAVAEARIASLTSRSNELKRELERRGRDIFISQLLKFDKLSQLKVLRERIQHSKVEKTDVSVTAKDLDNQNIVIVLQNNLSVIEELYRECFYETAKQEGLIEMLRKSYLDVRLMEKEKSDQISKLHNVINTQKWSLDKFQDISSDVDNLKVEISNFLNNSNNDSGVWEESLAGNFTEDLQDIAGQLLNLRELLTVPTGDCICGLEEENRRLRQSNEKYEIQINGLSQKIADLESIITNKEYSDKELQDLIEKKEKELHSIREQLAAVADEGETCESIKVQLHHAQELLNDTTSKLVVREAQCQHQERTVQTLREQLDEAKEVSKEYCSLRGSTCAAQKQVRSLRSELKQALRHCALMDDYHRAEVKTLETALREAQSRGAALCAEARRAMHGVRAWTQRRRHMQEELEEQINQKECQIKKLKHWLERERNNATLTRESECLIDVDNRSTQCDCVMSYSHREQEEQIKQQESEIKLLKQRLQKENTFNLTRESERLAELENRSTDCECEKTEILIRYRDLVKQMKQKESQIKVLEQRLEREENNPTLTRETERVIEVVNKSAQCDCGKSLFEQISCDKNRSEETSGSKRQTTLSFNTPKDRKRQGIPSEESGSGMASSTPLPACPNATQTSPTRDSERLTELENRSTDCECDKTEMFIRYRDLEKQMKQKEFQIKVLEQRLERVENNPTLTRETERVMEVENRCTQCDCGKSLFEECSCDRNRREETSGCKRLTTRSFSTPKYRKRQGIPSEESKSGMASSTPLPACPNVTQMSPQTLMKRFFGDRWICSPSYHEAIVQNPQRCDATTCFSDLEQPSCSNRLTTITLISGNRQRRKQPSEASTSGIDNSTLRSTFPSASRGQYEEKRHSENRREYGSMEDVLTRVESAGAALQDSLKRWNRRASHHRI